MSSLDKERRKLEKAGFSGQTLEQAMALLERTNAPLLGKLLVKMVTKQEKTPSMALYEVEKGLREVEAKLGFLPEDPSERPEHTERSRGEKADIPSPLCFLMLVSPADQRSNRR